MEDKATLDGSAYCQSNGQLGLEGHCTALGGHDDAHQLGDSRRGKLRSFAVQLTQKSSGSLTASARPKRIGVTCQGQVDSLLGAWGGRSKWHAGRPLADCMEDAFLIPLDQLAIVVRLRSELSKVHAEGLNSHVEFLDESGRGLGLG